MKRIFLLAIVSFFSCTEEIPEGVISAKKFETILYDIHLADAALIHSNLSDRKLTSPKDSYYNYVYIKHKISRKEFETSVHYYSNNTADYKAMYDRILIKFTNQKNDLLRTDSLQQIEEKKIKDSINLANVQNKVEIDSLLKDSINRSEYKPDSLQTDSITTNSNLLGTDSLSVDSIMKDSLSLTVKKALTK